MKYDVWFAERRDNDSMFAFTPLEFSEEDKSKYTVVIGLCILSTLEGFIEDNSPQRIILVDNVYEPADIVLLYSDTLGINKQLLEDVKGNTYE